LNVGTRPTNQEGMTKTFRPWSTEQRWLLPPSVQELVAQSMLAQIRSHLGRQVHELSSDNGYFAETNLRELKKRRVRGFLAPGRCKHGDAQRSTKKHAYKSTLAREMTAGVRRGGHHSRYRLRKQIVKPVNGHIRSAPPSCEARFAARRPGEDSSTQCWRGPVGPTGPVTTEAVRFTDGLLGHVAGVEPGAGGAPWAGAEAGAAGAAAAAAVALAFFGAAAFLAAPGARSALRSTFWRFRRAFFFTCDLRRFIFIELRLSCLPTGRTMPFHGAPRQGVPAHRRHRGAVFQPVPSAAAVSRLRTSRR
jgi:hypothetical protein